uniref:family 20 glycosylhydrolase n=1 Tax=Tessaracoccus timonensis TaxID=2161816 RepID=UPI000D554084|nr:family 20 glycosylhydrolase [Tessaracoccus timonensis]
MKVFARIGAVVVATTMALGGAATAVAPAAAAPETVPPGLTNPTAGLKDVVPGLQQMTMQSTGTPWLATPDSRVIVVGDDAVVKRDAKAFATRLAAVLSAKDGIQVQAGEPGDAKVGDVVLRLGTVDGLDAARAAEGYGLVVADGVATATAKTATGLFYAEQTLLQSARTAGGAQAATVVDWPSYPDRSLHVDAARKYYSPEWFKQEIDRLSSYKVNQIQWHFSENEGFRLESKKHPEIMSDTYITQAEAKDIVAYAKQHHITIVPSLDVPGHMGQVISRKPEFAAADTDEGRKMLDYSKPEVRQFVKDLFTEFAPIFETDTWHIGGDEVFDMNTLWSLGSRYPQLAAYAKDVTGVADADVMDGYMHFLDEVATHVKGLGAKHVRVWSDLLYVNKHFNLPSDIEVAYWTKWHRAMPSSATLVGKGHKLFNVHDGYFYYVLPRCPTCAYHTRVPASKILAEWLPTKFSGNSEPVAAESITGASYAIWADKPDLETEAQVADGIRLPVTAMVERTWKAERAAGFDYSRWEKVVNVVDGLAKPDSLAPSPSGELVNLALASNGGTVTASGQETADWGPELAIDGDSSSRWSSNTADDASITVKLAKPAKIHHVRFLWEAACAAKYKLQVSVDGKDFVDASDVRQPSCGSPEEVTLNAATASSEWQYVRMQGIDRTPIQGTKWGISMFEFEVYGQLGDGPVPTPKRPLSLVPLPAKVEEKEGQFLLTKDTLLVAPGEAAHAAELFAARLRTATGFPLKVVDKADAKGAIVMKVVPDDKAAGTAAEGYTLSVRPDGVTITAPSAAGVFHGTQTLAQLFPPLIESRTLVLGEWAAQAVEISDAPRFGHRSVQVDVARSFLTTEEVKAIIDTMAMFKQNRLHLHLADDQGWRIEITNEGKAADDPVDYTQLTKVSGKSAMLLAGSNTWKQELGHHGYYTQAEYKDLVAYAASRYITVIPEIDVPGHTNALLHAIPQLNSEKSLPRPTGYGTAPEQNNGNVGNSALDVDNPQTWVSLKHIFKQLADMTPGQYLHMGGDESHAMVQTFGHAEFNRFVKKSTDLVHSLGRTAMGWNETAVADLNPGDIVHYWIGDKSITRDAALNKGAKVVVSQADRAYLDMKYAAWTPIGLTWAGTGDLDKYYSWDPAKIISGLTEEHLLGVEAPTWSETIRGGYEKEFLVFPRAIAHAEVGWTPQTSRKLDEYLQRMAAVGARLQVRGSNFYDGPKVQWNAEVGGTPTKAGTDEARVDVALLAAPGTVASKDGAQVSVDASEVPAGSALKAPLSATIDFGDKSKPVAATFVTDQARDAVHSAGTFRVGATHRYAAPGTYDVKVTFSDGRVVASRVTVEAGWKAPAGFVYDSCKVPTIQVENKEVRDDARVIAKVTGLQPKAFVDLLWNGHKQGTVLTDAEGSAEVSHYVNHGTPSGDYLLRVQSPDGKFVEAVVTVQSMVPRPTGEVISGVTVKASSEADNETAPNGFAAAAVDGNPNTFWHSRWAAPEATYPHTLTFDLGKSYDLESIVWLPRQDSENGRVKTGDISVSKDGTTWTKILEKAPFAQGGEPTNFSVKGTARYVKMDLLEPQAADQVWATVGEVSFRGLPEGQQPTEPAPVVAEQWKPADDCATPDPEPTEPTPTEEPTDPTPTDPAPTGQPTVDPTAEPTEPAPTDRPTATPTGRPTGAPTATPEPSDPGKPRPGLPQTGR